mmetsp:Transcript_34167/g.62849  ORF Transcript_34167/g.62849 Transcript_34167/m.62849 type:complete len:236 (+) Transcript_34167:139-846(+)
MKFTLLKLSALTLIAVASTVSAKNGELRGSKKPLPELNGAIQMGGEPDLDVALSNESSDETPEEAVSSDSSFFPEEMNEEDKNRSRNRSGNNNNDDDRRPQKKNASQKRQDQRDSRRSQDNPNRSQREEQNERNRKSNQSKNRGNRCADPSEPGCGNDNFPRNREAKRNFRCNNRGNSCNYHRANPEDEPNRRRAGRDSDCVRNCRNNDDRFDDDNIDACTRRCAADAEAGLAQE